MTFFFLQSPPVYVTMATEVISKKIRLHPPVVAMARVVISAGSHDPLIAVIPPDM